jgi:hypothetical protein
MEKSILVVGEVFREVGRFLCLQRSGTRGLMGSGSLSYQTPGGSKNKNGVKKCRVVTHTDGYRFADTDFTPYDPSQ